MNDFQLISLIVDNEENLIEIRDTSRKICESLGFSHLEQVKITTSVSEIGRNIYEYAKKGTIQFFYINNKNKQGIKIVATDQGPGIKNLDKILQGKYISRTGMGSGIKGSRSLMDEFQIESLPQKGTSIHMSKYLLRDKTISQEELRSLHEEFNRISKTPKELLIAELEIQNKELLNLLEELNENKLKTESLNMELMETNLDIIALNKEMESKNTELDQLNKSLNQAVEQLNSKNSELKAFNYTVSHDLKAPLRGITGYSQELIRKHQTKLSERGVFCVNQITSASKQLDALIEDLLSYSKLDTEIFQKQEVKSKDLITSILDHRQSIIEENSIEVLSKLRDIKILGWENGLNHVISNLIDNAFKYTGKSNPPKVKIETKIKGEEFIFMITDNGIGFDMKYHDRMYELFHRLVRREDFEGTGAGLAIVKKIIEKHKGKIWAKSEPGKGATFTFTLPVK